MLGSLLEQCGYAGEPLVVAVSGGVDSMVLLAVTAAFAKARGVRCVAAHVNHGLRPDAVQDAVVVQQAAAALGADFTVRTIEPGAIPFETGSRGVEADARTCRHALLAEMARESGTKVVLFAHHADDQLETVLLRLIRGTSPSGLAGMRPVRELNGITYLRPLLSVTKRDLQAYAAETGIAYREDETNASDLYLRNRIRHYVLPALMEMAPAIAPKTHELTRLLQDENDYLDVQARQLLDLSTLAMGEDTAAFDCRTFASAALPLQRRAIHILLYCLASVDWTAAHVESIVRLIRSDDPSARVSLPEDWTAWREYRRLRIGKAQWLVDSRVETLEWSLTDMPSVHWRAGPGLIWRFERVPLTPDTKRKRDSRFETCIPAVASVKLVQAETSLQVQPMGLGGHRKLQDCFVDVKIPNRLRSLWPIVYIGESPVWVPGVVRTSHQLIENGSSEGWLLSCHFEDTGGPHAPRS